jgi:hypothetical protein
VYLELITPVGFVLLVSLGALYAGLALIHYVRSREVNEAPHVLVALFTFTLQYLFILIATALGNYLLWPTIVLFLTFIALLIAIQLGIQANSRAGFRIALAGFFTLGGYICKIVSEYREVANFYHW